MASVALAEWVGNDIGPYVLPNIHPCFLAASYFGSPQTSKHGYSVLRMVSHHVQGLSTLQPLLCGIHFTLLDNRVEVARRENVHLSIEAGEEPPDHRKHMGRVGKEVMGKLANRAEVQAIIGAGQVAKVDHHRVVG